MDGCQLLFQPATSSVAYCRPAAGGTASAASQLEAHAVSGPAVPDRRLPAGDASRDCQRPPQENAVSGAAAAQPLLDAVRLSFGDFSLTDLRRDAAALKHRLAARHPPTEDAEMQARARALEEQFINEHDETNEQKLKHFVIKSLKRQVYHWEPVEMESAYEAAVLRHGLGSRLNLHLFSTVFVRRCCETRRSGLTLCSVTGARPARRCGLRGINGRTRSPSSWGSSGGGTCWS